MNNRDYSDYILQAEKGEILTARAPMKNVSILCANGKFDYDIGHTFRVEYINHEGGRLHCLDEYGYMAVFNRLDMAGLERAASASTGDSDKQVASESSIGIIIDRL